jgi:amino acid adenylation domain-containing protein
MTDQNTIPRISIQPTSGFIPFEDQDIEQSIPQRFEQQVRAYGDRLAIKSDHETFTFTSLNQTANRIARMILSRRGDSAQPIALLFDHGAAVLVSILAILKAGKFYVVLDASYPPDRLKYMLEDSGAKLVVADANNVSFAGRLSNEALEVINFEDVDTNLADRNLDVYPTPDSLAMILYTSGSTGRPKGVTHTHRNVLVDARNITNGWCVTAQDRWLLHTSVSFANSVRTIYSSLLNGGAIYPYDIKKQGFGGLPNWLLSNEITIMRSVPTTFRDFVNTLGKGQIFPAVRLLSVGGEPLLRADLNYFNRHFLAHCVLAHALGPTECLTVCWALIPHGTQIAESKLPIGYQLKDKDVLVLDETGCELGEGEVGEIAVKSHYISPGYWRDPERTKAAFLPDPMGSDARIYLTGDLGVRGRDGCLRHVGREDFQVKVRGFRIDVSEIEIALGAIDGIEDAVVVGRQEDTGEQRLVAYFVPATRPPITVTKIRQGLARVLPDYMMPSTFVSIDAMPQTPNGKTDRLRLPMPTRDRPNLENPFVPPGTVIEAELAAIWAEVLSLDQVGINDHFFELGGDSLLATRIIARITTRFKVDIPIKTLFESPTVAKIAEILVINGAKVINDEDLPGILGEIESLSDEETQNHLRGKNN